MYQIYHGASEFHQPVQLKIYNWTGTMTNLDAVEAIDALDGALGMGRSVGDGSVVDFISSHRVLMRGYFDLGLR